MKRMLTLTIMAGTMVVTLSAMACDRFPSPRPAYGGYGNGYGYSSRYAPRYGQGYSWPRTYAKPPVYGEDLPVVVRRAPVKPIVRQPIVKQPIVGLPPVEPNVAPALTLPPADLSGPATILKKPSAMTTQTPADLPDLPDLPLPPTTDTVTAPAVVPNPMDEQIAPQNPVALQQN